MAGKKDKQPGTPEIVNRKARHDYHIGDTLEVGIRLVGSEVKSVRAGRVSLAEGYVRAQAEPISLDLYGVHIDEYAAAGRGRSQHQPTRGRTLLAHKREIKKLALASSVKGMTIVPLKIYFKDGKAKLLIGVGSGKKAHDKREDIKKRDAEREMRRATSKRP